ncbi:ParB N-terminal domain-containing protein [Candidatus Bathyarchaeota archaeon]|nr:ParB N-terminal domain-containing protein [Candidatus Bathyarchaeota archaeon]
MSLRSDVGVRGEPSYICGLQPQLTLIHIDKLNGHEEVDPFHLQSLMAEIESDGFLRMPIVVDRHTNTIIDGHHRRYALKQLNCKRIPVIFINYDSCEVVAAAWRYGEEVTKDSVLNAALSGRRLPPKTTKHLVLINGVFKHISAMEEAMNIPLERLK